MPIGGLSTLNIDDLKESIRGLFRVAHSSLIDDDDMLRPEAQAAADSLADGIESYIKPFFDAAMVHEANTALHGGGGGGGGTGSVVTGLSYDDSSRTVTLTVTGSSFPTAELPILKSIAIGDDNYNLLLTTGVDTETTVYLPSYVFDIHYPDIDDYVALSDLTGDYTVDFTLINLQTITKVEVLLSNEAGTTSVSLASWNRASLREGRNNRTFSIASFFFDVFYC